MSLFTTVIDAIFPPLCVHCNREGSWLCSVAADDIKQERVIVNPLIINGVEKVLVRGSYDCEPLAQFIQKLKYHYWTGAGSLLHGVVAPPTPELNVPSDTVIVPVPLHSRRHRERGFNQSLYISKALSRATGLPVKNLLQRTRYTPPQAQLTAKERVTNIIGAFGQGRVASWPKSVILVDDVITTGSTIAECAAVLRKYGVRKITAVALAKG